MHTWPGPAAAPARVCSLQGGDSRCWEDAGAQGGQTQPGPQKAPRLWEEQWGPPTDQSPARLSWQQGHGTPPIPCPPWLAQGWAPLPLSGKGEGTLGVSWLLRARTGVGCTQGCPEWCPVAPGPADLGAAQGTPPPTPAPLSLPASPLPGATAGAETVVSPILPGHFRKCSFGLWLLSGFGLQVPRGSALLGSPPTDHWGPEGWTAWQPWHWLATTAPSVPRRLPAAHFLHGPPGWCASCCSEARLTLLHVLGYPPLGSRQEPRESAFRCCFAPERH